MRRDIKYIMRPDGSVESMSTDEWIPSYPPPEEWEAGHRVGLSTVGVYRVSTVFLSIDHNWGDGPPILFETMVFDHSEGENWSDVYCGRYCTRAEAEAGHARIVAALRAGVDPSELDDES